jgi:hypothetical protein
MHLQRFALLAFSVLVIAGCTRKTNHGDFNQEAICTAAIATIMSQSPSIIRAEKFSEKVTSLSYIRPADGSHWNYRCMLEGDRIVWASGNGRWRNSGSDEVVSFLVKGKTLSISQRFSDNSSDTKAFTSESLGVSKPVQ